MGVHKTFLVFFIFNPLDVTKMTNSLDPRRFRNCPMSCFMMKLMRVCSFFSNVDFLIYASQNRYILLIFYIRVDHLLIVS
jgi:hypothetical protein